MFDSLENAVAAIAPHAVERSGTILAVVTAGERLELTVFRGMLDRIGVSLALHSVCF